MVVYNFKRIAPIPPAEEFIDIILTRTQRKTPTVVHPGYKITRIRNFYMRKVKFTEQNITERLGQIIQEFPRLEDVHPFYADLMNVLYDRDHYKLALGQVNTAKNIVGNLSRDYVRLLKYGESLYRCKQLKRAALGRMCTVLKKLKAAFGYLEEVRKHIARLPALDPSARTILLTGYPNVGKSSFMNKVTRAEVEVQPYAFTTKSLYVGHMDYRYLRWQVVDTPGILDRPLEERSTVEMQAITALAHLQCCVLYFLDVSEQCGYTIEQQIALLHSIKPLFANKEVLLIANKVDVVPFEHLRPEARALIERTAQELGVEFITMSNETEENINTVKTTACDRLLNARVEASIANTRKYNSVLNRLTVVMPKPRDNIKREPFIPESVQRQRAGELVMEERKTERDLMWENGGPGVYAADYRKYYLLEDDEWRFDVIPEIMDGKNVFDFIDPDIEQKLANLEAEEEALAEQAALDPDQESDLDEEEEILAAAIRERKTLARQEGHRKAIRNHPRLPRGARGEIDAGEVEEKLEYTGFDSSGVLESMRERGRKRTRSLSRARGDDDTLEGEVSMDLQGGDDSAPKRARSASRVRDARSQSRHRPQSLEPSQERIIKKSEKTAKVLIRKDSRKGEADRRQFPKLKKHLLAGKMGLGTRRSR